MRTKMLAITAILLITAPLLSAGTSKGIKAGIVSSSQDFDYTEIGDPGFDRYRGMQFGVFMEFSPGPVVSFVGAVDYTEHGHKTTFLLTTPESPLTDPPTSEVYKSKVSYVSLGALLKFGFPLIGAKTYAIAGPRMNLKVGSDATVGSTLLFDKFKSSVMGITVGLGQEFALGPVSPLLELTYNQDLADSFKSEFVTVRNSSFSLVAGLKF